MHGEKGTGKGLKYVRVSRKNKGALHRTLKRKRVRGNSEQGRNLSQRAGREEPEEGSLGTWEGSEQGVVGVRTREESEQGRWDSEQGVVGVEQGR